MAEKIINWANYINHAANGAPSYYWSGIDFDKYVEAPKRVWNHPFAQKVRNGVDNAVQAWWENVNLAKIKDKDTAWRIGLVVGLVESAAFTFLLPGSGMIKGGINFTATQGTFIGARYFNIPIEPQAKSFFKGISAGGAYFSLPLGGISEIASGITEGTPTPIATAPSVSENIVSTPIVEADIAPIVAPSPESTPSVEVKAPEDVQKAVESKVEQIQNNQEFKTSLAANVGARLTVADEVIAKVLANQGKSISNLSPDVLDKARMAIQHAMENQVNTSASETLHNIVTATPDINISSEDALNAAKTATKANFEAWLDNPVGQDSLAAVAQGAIDEQMQAAPVVFSSKITQFISENQANAELFTEHTVAPGETAGHLLIKMGLSVTWDGSDWEGFAALNQMNLGSFAALKDATGLSQEEFDKLILRIQSGDKEAYREMINKMGLIRAGSKIRLLTSEGARRLLALKTT